MQEKATPAIQSVTAEAVPERALAYALLGFTMVVWGGSFVAARALLAPTDPGDAMLTPAVLAALRFLLASAIFIPVLLTRWARGRRIGGTPARRLTARDLLWLAALGQIGISVCLWLQYTGVRLTNAGIASILVVGLIPIATALVARVRLGEALRPIHGVALSLGLAGVVVVTLQRDGAASLTVSGSVAWGALALLANAATFAVYSTLVRGARERFDALTLTAGTMALGAISLALLATVTGGWGAIGELSGEQWLWVLFLSLICSVVAYFCYNRVLSILEAGRAATWVYLEPPVALLMGALLLNETITIPSILGGVIIAAAVWIVSRAK